MRELNREALLKEVEKGLEMAVQFYGNGNYQECHQIAKKIEPICLQLESWENYIVAKNYMSAFYITSEIGINFEKTERHFVETLEIASQKLYEKSPNLENAYGYLGYWYAQIMRNPIKAKPIFEISLQIAMDRHGEISMETITAYNNIGYVHAISDDIPNALMYMEKAIYLLEELNKTDKQKPSITHQISFYVNLGSFCFRTTEREKGYFYLKIALQKCENNDFYQKNQILSYIYGNLSNFYVKKKDYTQALHYSEQALALRKKYNSLENTEIASTYFDIGIIHKFLNDYKKAVRFFQKSLEIRTQFFESPNSEVANSLFNLGKCMYHQKEFDKAIDYCQKSFAYLFSKFQSQNIFETPEMEQSTSSIVCLKTMQLKATCLFESYRVNKKDFAKINTALKILHQAAHLLDEVKKGYQLTESTLFFLSISEITEIFNTAMELTFLMRKPKEAFFFCEKNKANLLLSSIQENLSKAAINISHSFLEKEIELKSKLTFLEKQIAKEKAKNSQQRTEILHQWKSQFFDFHQAYLQLVQQLEADYPDYYQLKYETKTASITEIQNSLSEDQVMVNYFVGKNRYYIFLITSNGFEVFEDEKPDDFEQTIERFLQAIQQHQFEKYTKTALQLYQWLLQPFEFDLMDAFAEIDAPSSENEALGVENPKQLIIIPHGILNYLPFEALICSPIEDRFTAISNDKVERTKAYQSLDYLLLYCEVSYHYSATLWHYLLTAKSEKAPTSHDFVGFAPVYQSEVGSEMLEAGSGNTLVANERKETWKAAVNEVRQWATRSEALRGNGNWTPLPHSKLEAENIAGLFATKGLESQTFLYEQATKEQFREAAEKSRFLLVAVHGVVNDAHPKLSGLVFYPKKRDVEEAHFNIAPPLSYPTSQPDCILSMEETYHLNLQKTDLVVLSSCESGIGELAKGEGMMAVNRGFLYAGAKNVVSTLFKVYDRPSSLLTQYLFEGVLEGMNYTAALRQAKLRLLKIEGVDVKSWCGFVLIGGR